MKVSVQISLDGSPSKHVQPNSYAELKTWLASLGPNALSITKITWQILDLEKKPVKSITTRGLGGIEVSNLNQPREYETWASRWIAYPVICLFPAERREEWIGDLYEIRHNLLTREYPTWLVNGIIIARTGLLIAAAVKVWLIDLVAAGLIQRP